MKKPSLQGIELESTRAGCAEVFLTPTYVVLVRVTPQGGLSQEPQGLNQTSQHLLKTLTQTMSEPLARF